MKQKKPSYYSLADIVSRIGFFAHYLRKRWWLFLLFGIAGAVSGFVYYPLQKPKYEAQCTFIVEEKQNGMGSLGSIASQFGFDIGSGGGGGGSIFAGDNILDILRSKKIVEGVLLTPLDSKVDSGKTLADLYLDFSSLRNKWKAKPELSNLQFARSPSLTRMQDSVLNIVYEMINEKNLTAQRTNKKGTIIKVSVTAENDLFAKLTTERLVVKASEMYLTIKTGTAQENIARMQRRSDSLLLLLNRKSYSAATSQALDVNPGLKTANVPTEIAMRDKTVIATLYTEVTKNLEASKLLLSQETPVIQVLDSPGLTLYDNKKGRFYLMAVIAMVALSLCFFAVTVIYFFKQLTTASLLNAEV